MKNDNILLSLLVISFLILTTSCEDLFNPSPDNKHDESRIFTDAPFAEGLLLNGYKNLPDGYNFEEVASDDAVTNDINSNLRRMATGEWSSRFTPVSVWDNAYENIYYMNYFLSIVDNVEWSYQSPERNALFKARFKGEAYALRAWYYFELLKRHGGIDENGNLSGVIILDKHLESSEWDSNVPRNEYEICVDFIVDDCDSAISLLPLEYGEIGDPYYDRVFGSMNEQRINGIFAKALKSRVLLQAASPAFNLNNSADKWEDAANSAAELLSEIGGVSGLSNSGVKWYANQNDDEIIWRGNATKSLSLEEDVFPPSLYGKGEVNPSQNLVDAFPMVNGYPITSVESGYVASDPYKNRDPRLSQYIIFDGNSIDEDTIHTDEDSPQDGINQIYQSSRTGYYLKKLINENVRLTPGNILEQVHFYTFFRYTEIFLNYAEAANEAWGPDADPNGYGYTSRQVIAAIRARAGLEQPDQYLQSLSTKEEFRELIQNERRIELCFEGFRFWDMRRWEKDLSETATGMKISENDYQVIDVEERNYQSFMNYGPIPNKEILINEELIQNNGW